jgi:hypothetical protein
MAESLPDSILPVVAQRTHTEHSPAGNLQPLHNSAVSQNLDLKNCIKKDLNIIQQKNCVKQQYFIILAIQK